MAALKYPLATQQSLQRAGDYAESGSWAKARRECKDILQADPSNAHAFHILGAVSSCEGDLKNAEEYLSKAVDLDPRNPAWLRDLAVVRIAAADWDGALNAISSSLAINPSNTSVIGLQARAQWSAGRIEAALTAFDRWKDLQRDAVEAWLGSARCLLKLNRLLDAGARARCALHVMPDCVAAHQLLAQIHFDRFEPDQALTHCLELLRLRSGDSVALALLALAYYHLGDTDAAVSMFRRAGPSECSAGLHAAFLAVLLHHTDSTPELLAKEHVEWAQCHGTVAPAGPAFSNPPLTGRRMRVAYLCTEPATSPAFRFLPSLLRNHHREKFEVSLYCKDSSLRACGEEMGVEPSELRDVTGWTERTIAEQMRREGVDILVSFSGHFGTGSLLVAAMRAAPIQVSYPDYPSTTGLPEMDYIFTDRWTCAPGQEIQYTERPYWLESGYLVYDPPKSARFMKALPARRNGFITFGFFQRPAKLNSRVWDALAEILRQVENSRLFLNHASAELDAPISPSRLRLVAALESRGIDPARVQFRGRVPLDQHMRLISTVDIALDSFPYTGQTTTCECLWMGVPVITLAGKIHVSRVSAALLMRLGLENLVAGTVEEYIRIASRTARDLPALEALRQGLRRRFQASTLVDGARLAREVEEAYRSMWQQWESREPRGKSRFTRFPTLKKDTGPIEPTPAEKT